jgi:hypothetical protein
MFDEALEIVRLNCIDDIKEILSVWEITDGPLFWKKFRQVSIPHNFRNESLCAKLIVLGHIDRPYLSLGDEVLLPCKDKL